MKILVLNAGSSSLKFKLFDMKGMRAIATGMIEQIGESSSSVHIKRQSSLAQSANGLKKNISCLIADHNQALSVMFDLLKETDALHSVSELYGIGHRVVHGGENFKSPVLIDQKVTTAIAELVPLSPLHNPANLTGIEVALKKAKNTPQVAVFDTAFHQTIPQHSFLYALPYELYEKYKVRRYGFHGTSHHYVSKKAAEFLNMPVADFKVITLHLGNGASAAAIDGGKCVDTSMGLTPLEGLVMGTRCGDIDPAILFYLTRETGMDMQELDSLLNKESGLKGICGNNDMRAVTELAAKGNELAQLALDIFCFRLKKYIGSYLAVLGGADCIVFTGGIGENSAIVRENTCFGMSKMGLEIDEDRNRKSSGEITDVSTKKSNIKILVVPTDEEFEIATHTLQVVNNS